VTGSSRPAVWAGVEPSHLTIGGRRRDQLAETGHADRLADIDRFVELGVAAVRYPVLWGWRGEPTDWDWAGVRLRRLAAHGIEPVVGLLHHGWGPDGIDPLDPAYAARFAAYATEVARRFPDVRTFLPVNEPLTTARFGGLYGWWDPCERDDATFARLLVAECQAIRAAARALHRHDPSVRVLVNEDACETYGTPEVADVVSFYNDRRWLTFDLVTGRVDPHHPMWEHLTLAPGIERALEELADDPEYPDLLGLDHYITSDRFLDHRTESYPADIERTRTNERFVDVELARVPGFEVDGFWRSLRQTWDRYRLPMVLAEVHLAGNEQDEVAWWAEAWRQAGWAVDAGIPVEAVTSWAVFGAVDWDSLLRHESGSYQPGCFDVRTGEPALTALGAAVASTASGGFVEPAVQGWWRQPDRALTGPAPEIAA
jgi:dTDP-4-dehydrorhamnose reductase